MIQLILIALLSLVAQLFLPWWSLALVAFLVCFWRSNTATKSFLAGFVGIALVWLIYALIIQWQTDGAYVGRISQLLFQTNTTVLPALVTAILGGLVGGLAGVSGYFVRQATGNQLVNRTS
ncbi:hypothetical protein GCM10027341_27620 [Spirosoma knui]